MRFGFTALSDSAKTQLESLGIRYFPQDTMWVIETEAYDQRESEWRGKRENYESSVSIPGELKKEWNAQGTRVWKNPDTGRYFYLIKDHVFWMQPTIYVDRRFNPP